MRGCKVAADGRPPGKRAKKGVSSVSGPSLGGRNPITTASRRVLVEPVASSAQRFWAAPGCSKASKDMTNGAALLRPLMRANPTTGHPPRNPHSHATHPPTTTAPPPHTCPQGASRPLRMPWRRPRRPRRSRSTPPTSRLGAPQQCWTTQRRPRRPRRPRFTPPTSRFGAPRQCWTTQRRPRRPRRPRCTPPTSRSGAPRPRSFTHQLSLRRIQANPRQDHLM